MTKLVHILQQSEGRRFEFKELLPTHSELVKKIIAFTIEDLCRKV